MDSTPITEAAVCPSSSEQFRNGCDNDGRAIYFPSHGWQSEFSSQFEAVISAQVGERSMDRTIILCLGKKQKYTFGRNRLRHSCIAHDRLPDGRFLCAVVNRPDVGIALANSLPRFGGVK